jgi:SPP1 gp7 family putative phage head morphogenesis protein
MNAADATARLVQVNHIVGAASRRHRVPRARYPKLIEADYAAVLVGMVAEWRASIAPLLAELPALVASARMDDSSEGRRTRALIDRGRYVIVRQSQSAPFIAQRYAEQTVKHHGREFSRQTKAALGVEVPTLDRALPTRVGHFVSENVSRIRSLGEKTLNDVEDLIARAFTTGQSVEDLTAEIMRRFDIAESRARLLAHDQISTLNAQVARMRHREVGVSLFRWKTRNDGRVRPHHAVKHDKIFPYGGSRAPSFFPGDEVNCRCEEVPVFDEILEKAFAGKGRKRK